MKFIFISLFAVICFSASAQDFNYTFYPEITYNRISKVLTLDTLTKTTKFVSDTSTAVIASVVKKDGDILSISALRNPTEIHYREQVKFKGITPDGALSYTAQTQKFETIIVNPIQGFAIIIFRNKTGKFADDTDQIFHYFGNVNSVLKQYSPQ